MSKPTLLEQIRQVASEGKATVDMKLWRAQIYRLQKKGFRVTINSLAEHEGQYNCTVSWEYPQGKAAREMLEIAIRAMQQFYK